MFGADATETDNSNRQTHAPILPRKRYVDRLPLLPRRNRGDLDLLRVRAFAGTIQRDAILAGRSGERVAQAARALRLHRRARRFDDLRLAGGVEQAIAGPEADRHGARSLAARLGLSSEFDRLVLAILEDDRFDILPRLVGELIDDEVLTGGQFDLLAVALGVGVRANGAILA